MTTEKELKLKREFRESVDLHEPVNHRRYTFVKNNDQYTLSIGLRYDFQKINSKRDEVLGQWAMTDGIYNLYFQVHLESDSESSVGVKDAILRRTLASHIKQIIKADKSLINRHTYLKDSPVIIYFKSSLPYYNKIENWGKVQNYLNDENIDCINGNNAEIEIVKLLLIPYINREIEALYGKSKTYSLDNITLVNIESNGLNFNYNVLINANIDSGENASMSFTINKAGISINKVDKISC